MLRFILILSLAAFGSQRTSLYADELDPGDDYTASTGGKAVTWEPMIVQFSASSSHGSSSLVAAATGRPALGDDVIGEANQWLGLKPLIEPHKGGTGYERGDSVICAWHRKLDGDKPVYTVFGSGAADGDNKGRIHSLVAEDHTVSLSADFDILMNATAAKKDDLLKLFVIRELEITAYLVSKDPTDFRAGILDSTPRFTVYKLNTDVPDEARAFQKVAHNFTGHDGFIWNMANDHLAGQSGVYQLELKLTVEGRMEAKERPQTRTFVGAIRIATVASPKLVIDKLEEQHARKPGQTDIIKNGRVVGTKQN